MGVKVYKLIFYVPGSSAESVKNSIFLTGAGAIGNYSNCSWETEGIGQFMPLVGSTPVIGSQGLVERVAELRVEILCTEETVKPAIKALKSAHPYEEPAYEVVSVLNHMI
jgi:hypothetical protein